jgi:ABC-2 type transport system ATP-binding protein
MGLRIHDVEHSFGHRLALDGVSFDVAPGVITGLLGPNGAGKTTLLRIMLGVLSPDRGEVRFDGHPVGEPDRRHWGYMPQERGLYPGMPAGDQVAHFGRLHGLSRRDAISRAHALLAELDLEDRWNDRTDKLSGGMQQRLQLATSLVHDPAVIVLACHDADRRHGGAARRGRLVHLPPRPAHHRSPGDAARGGQRPGRLLTQDLKNDPGTSRS